MVESKPSSENGHAPVEIMGGVIPKGFTFSQVPKCPPEISRRVDALKKYQKSMMVEEAAFYKEIHALECRFAQQMQGWYDKRKAIITGVHEPTDEECKWKVDLDVSAKADNGQSDQAEKVSGIPGFWLKAMQNVSLLGDMIREHDERVLQDHLVDVTVNVSEDPMMFTITFHFSANDFFENETLTKSYYMKCEPSDDDPFDFDGPEVVSCKGCPISWKKNMNLTVKTVHKHQKNKKDNSTRVVTRTHPNDSFFNFFSPPASATPEYVESLAAKTNGSTVDDVSDEEKDLIAADIEIGHFLRNDFVPRSVLYFTGEAGCDDEEDDDYDDDQLEDEDDDDDDYEDDDDN